MDVHKRPSYLRSAVLLVVFLSHGSLILVFLREKPTYRDRDASPELSTTIFFINPQPRLPLPSPETSRIPHRPTRDLQHQLRPDAAISSLDTTVPLENRGSAASPPTDWFAEAHRSAAEIADRGEPGRAAESPSSPTPSAPWDPHLRLLESTGHGLKLRIPVRIPGDIIDHCFANMDLGHNEGGKWELYQLKCAFRKQPARGDLFDSLHKPSEPPK
jgi:hypothetical protein